ncbi:MAG: helix-turn-helix transcriptional regulator [Candidatus Woesearchaeota archaeon]
MNHKTIFGIMLLVAFLLFIVTMIFIVRSIEKSYHIDPLELEAMTHEQIIQRVYDSQNGFSLSLLLPLLGFFGVLIGATSYFLFSGGEGNSINATEDYNKIRKASMGIVRRMMSHDERKVFDLLVSRNGMLMQSEVSSIEGFGKVKAHRIIEQMETKGIITKTSAGKQRIIRLMPEFKDIIEVKEDGFTR